MTATDTDALRQCHHLLAEDLDALGSYAPADAVWLLQAAATTDDIAALARELAAVHGRSTCFLDPRHGPAVVSQALGEHTVPVCAADADLLAQDHQPRARMVRLAERWVPWYAAGPTYDAYAAGYFGDAHDDLREHAFALTGVESVGR